MIKHAFIFLLVIGFCYSLYGQKVVDLKKNYVPSPEAYSLMQYAAIPVSKYTGIPSISVPIYTIRVGDNSIPISLNYHASGIKIAQEASWVGLGWNLSAGGAISRSICGKDDINNYAVKTEPVPTVKYLSKDSTLIEIDGDFYDGGTSMSNVEPDVFQYNFDGYSGKFFFRRGAMTNKLTNKFVCSNPEQNLRIETDDIQKGFIITTPENVKYIFEDKETSKKWAKSYPNQSGNNPGANWIQAPSILDFDPANPITSWYLSRIEYPTGDVVYFDYKVEVNSYLSPAYLSEQYIDIRESKLFVQTPTTEALLYEQMPFNSNTVFVNMQYTEFYPRLTAIRWKNGFLKFVESTEKRKDIRSHPNQGGDGPRFLSAIELYQKDTTTPLQTFSFHYSYFMGKDMSGKVVSQPDFLRSRLKLDEITIKGTGTVNQKYQMQYNEKEPLPQKNSYSCDEWGYYNGSLPYVPYFPFVARFDVYNYTYSDKILIPTTLLFKKGTTFRLYDEDKLPSEQAQAGILTALISPTGGRTEFKYENNQVLDDIDWKLTSTPSTMVFGYKEVGEKSKTITFDMPFKGYIEIACSYTNANGNNTSIAKEKSTPIIAFSNNWRQWGLPVTELQNKVALPGECYHFVRRIPCGKGTHQITLQTKEKAELNVAITMQEATYTAHEKKVGGLRIAEIKSPVSTKKFVYKDYANLSSGQLNRKSQFSIVKTSAVYHWNLKDPVIGYFTYLEYNSNSLYPSENPYSSYFMGYTEVTTTESYKDESIVEKDFFYNEKEKPARGMQDPGFVMPLNGLPLEHRVYSNGNVLKQKTIHFYEYRLLDQVIGFKVATGYPPYNYPIHAYHVAPVAVIDTIYATPASGQPTVFYPKLTEYAYNTKNYQVRRETKTEGGVTRKHEIFYTVDYEDTYYADAVNKYNYVSTPVQEDFYVGNSMEKKLCHIHNLNAMLTPWKEYVFYGAKLYYDHSYFDGKNSLDREKPEVTYLSYDKRGRNTSLSTRMGQTVVLVWGYQHQHVIAQISNATLSMVQQAGVDFDAIGDKDKPSESDWQLLHSLRTKLPRSHVTVTRYEPLIGIISQTNPRGITTRYTYDEFGRLKEVIENEGGAENLLRKLEYKYANEQ